MSGFERCRTVRVYRTRADYMVPGLVGGVLSGEITRVAASSAAGACRVHAFTASLKASVSVNAMIIEFAALPKSDANVALVQGKRQPRQPFTGRCHQRLTHYSCEEPILASLQRAPVACNSLIS